VSERRRDAGSALDRRGGLSLPRAQAASGPDLARPWAVAVESAGTLLAIDPGRNAVLRVDPVGGARLVVSDLKTGGGPGFVQPFDVAVIAGGDAVVRDDKSLLRVGAVTGDRALLSGTGRGSGPPFVDPRRIAIDGDSVLVADPVPPAIVRVDPSSGDRTLVWDGSPPLSFPGGVAMEATGSLVITSNGAVVRFNPSTGATTILTDASHGAGPFLQLPGVIAVEPPGTLIVADHSVLTGAESVLRVDPVSGDRTYVAR